MIFSPLVLPNDDKFPGFFNNKVNTNSNNDLNGLFFKDLDKESSNKDDNFNKKFNNSFKKKVSDNKYVKDIIYFPCNFPLRNY